MKKLIIILLLFVVHKQMSAQNYKFQALYIYNIAQRISWPSASNNFNIGVIGCKELEKELELISKSRKIGAQQINIKSIPFSFDNFNNCQLLYLGRSSSSKIEALLSKVGTQPILLIGDKVGLTGVGINFIDNSKKIDFEIYPSIIKAHHLQIANSMLQLGVIKE